MNLATLLFKKRISDENLRSCHLTFRQVSFHFDGLQFIVNSGPITSEKRKMCLLKRRYFDVFVHLTRYIDCNHQVAFPIGGLLTLCSPVADSNGADEVGIWHPDIDEIATDLASRRLHHGTSTICPYSNKHDVS